MNKIIICLLMLGNFLPAIAQQNYNMDLLSRWDNDSLPALGSQSYNSIWGYYDSLKNREYAIIGSLESTYFIDVTNPGAPVVRDIEAGKSTKCIHREYKNYKNYLYAVADEGLASLQIFDMQYLPDSVHKVYDSDSLSVRAHTLYVENDRLYLNSNTTYNGFFPMTILSMADPENPVLMGHLISPVFNGSPLFSHVHDSYIRNDTAWCSNGGSGFFIYDVRNASSPILLNAHTAYPDKGYNHSSALSPDGKILVYTDETMNMAVKIYDASNVNNLVLKSLFKSHEGAVAHNPFIKGNFIYLSYYHDGVYIYDISDPSLPTVAAFYDTYSQNGTQYAGYEGCWGVYPFLPSGIILASDMTNGLFVLKAADNIGVKEELNRVGIEVSPNPFSGRVNVEITSSFAQNVTLTLFDITGRELLIRSARLESGINLLELKELSDIPAGIYFLRAGSEGLSTSVKLLKE